MEQHKFGFELLEIPQQVVHDLTVSSTKIRNSLLAGEVLLANELLGYPYFLNGTVVHGDKMGRQLGFPTANIALHDTRKLVPAQGVYAVRVALASGQWNGALNIGYRPTFNGKELRIEVFITDFNEEIYGQPITVQFIEYLRADMKFDNIDDLVKQMHHDTARAREILKPAP
ncbi:hypothetical protein MKQ70_18795 [Chitinophaga sedimenti]|uniref:riboflavin kinase n=1 Tax=Chitinophaga sedimenti TaxID=2033606 RepID=UPI002004FDF8|nr:riboflavin kinase [Chitinophaga sedimenti]MCK7556950.1 hypothetical protein [Chitinophaga sedimenti]